MEEAAQKAEKVYGYFNNHYHAYTVKNCLEMAEMLNAITPEQREVKRMVEEYLEAKLKAPPPKPALALTAFMPEKIRQMNFPELLRLFMDHIRIKRINDVKDKEATLKKASDERVKARIREYHIFIDVPGRLVLQTDCADWSRCAPVKQFCKHVGKVMVVIPKDKAVNILRKMGSEREKWEFKPYVA